MSRSRIHRTLAALVAVGLVGGLGVVSAGAQEDFPPVDQPGVTDTEIKVGGVASVTNPLGGNYGSSFDGVEAYFDYINSKGGIYGRELVLDGKRDDTGVNNQSEVQGLLNEDVFAAIPISTLLFTGADLLADANIPTFGWNINEEWGSENAPGAPNLFGEKGSFLCFTCDGALVPWLTKKVGAKKVAILGYNVPQSAACVEGLENSFEKYPSAEIAFKDDSLAFGVTDVSAQVAQMKEDGVEFVTTCMDFNGTLTVAREMRLQGLDATQYLPNAYNHEFVEENAEFFEGSYALTFFTPFETRPRPKGLKLYEKWIKESGGDRNENSLAGWINADLFVTGLKAAGPDFTQQKVIDAINAIPDYTAQGLLAPIDWSIAHSQEPPLECTAISKIEDGKFVPTFGKKGKPFICFEDDAAKLPKNPQVLA
jgi:ABC-type branched-subunit amino acid transport system substrate-binding protein